MRNGRTAVFRQLSGSRAAATRQLSRSQSVNRTYLGTQQRSHQSERIWVPNSAATNPNVSGYPTAQPSIRTCLGTQQRSHQSERIWVPNSAAINPNVSGYPTAQPSIRNAALVQRVAYYGPLAAQTVSSSVCCSPESDVPVGSVCDHSAHPPHQVQGPEPCMGCPAPLTQLHSLHSAPAPHLQLVPLLDHLVQLRL
eukprot:363706-Chlamydomonas_euryale.AAC.3